jgi:hypothetical protein
LIGCGFDIELGERQVKLRDRLPQIVIPVFKGSADITPPSEERKERLRGALKKLPLSMIELVDLAADCNEGESRTKSERASIFEYRVMELLTNECGLRGRHLGGPSRPDGVIYSDKATDGGCIVDAKAYRDGFSLSQSEADKMRRYLDDNVERDGVINPTRWWSEFPDEITNFGFLFVTNRLSVGFNDNVTRLVGRSKHLGGGVEIDALLMAADLIVAGLMTPTEFLQECKKPGKITFTLDS